MCENGVDRVVDVIVKNGFAIFGTKKGVITPHVTRLVASMTFGRDEQKRETKFSFKG